MNTSFLLIGGNEGDRQANLDMAVRLMEASGTLVLQRSALYETAAWGKTDQPAFLNQALKVSTSLDAPVFLDLLLAIEEKMGRKRREKYGERNIDIDILFFNDVILRLPQLVIPHPEIQNRRFALAPMAEIAPGLIHPVLHRSIADLLAACPDKLEVTKINQS